MTREALIDEIAQTIYCDSYTQYGTCSLEHWKKTSEIQRQFFKGQAIAVLSILEQKGLLKLLE